VLLTSLTELVALLIKLIVEFVEDEEVNVNVLSLSYVIVVSPCVLSEKSLICLNPWA
jgi:hypothetical protein